MSNPANLTAIDLSSKKAGNKKDDFKMTPDEAKRIEEKMKDPEFMKLWVEYAQSLADPKVREEEEEYLRQVEEEAKKTGDDSFDFIFPTPVYCIELLECPDAKKGHRVGVNVCTSDKIEKFKEETTGDRMGSHWFVPVSVGVARIEPKTLEGADWEVFDAVFHPDTIKLANQSDKFMVFLTEIIVENINGGYKRRFDFKFRRLPSSVTMIGAQPKNQTVRRSATSSSSSSASDNNNSQREISLGPLKASFNEEEIAKRTKVLGGENNNNKKAASSSSTAASSSSSSATAAPIVTKNTGNVKMSVAHRGEIDLTDAWSWAKLDKRIGIPKELVLRAQLPTIDRASELDVDIVKGLSVEISCPAKKLQGSMLLDFTVEEVPVSAKFEKTKKELILVLKVVPPPAPPSAVAPADEKFEKEKNDNDDDDDQGENGKNNSEKVNKIEKKEQQAAEAQKQSQARNERLQRAQDLLEEKQKKEKQEEQKNAQQQKENIIDDAKKKKDQEEEEAVMRKRQEAWMKEEEDRKVAAAQKQKEAEAEAARKKKEQEEKDKKAAAEKLKQQQQQQKQTAADEQQKKKQQQEQDENKKKQEQQQQKQAAAADDNSNLLLIDDDDEDFLPKKNETESKKDEMLLREAAKKSADSQKQEEVMQAELDKKMKQLPLTNAFIFSID